jgi:D-alanyl-D-alanine carboxypeptidase
MVVERLTGRPLADVIDARVVRPLHLHHTYLAASEAFRGRYAHGYVTPADTGDGYLDLSGRNDATWSWAAGAMVSTVDDLARFTTALVGGRLLPPAQLAQMRQVVPASTDRLVPGASYGLGLMQFVTPCGTFWGHWGSIPGYKSRSFSDGTGRRSVEVFTPTESTDAVVAAADALTDAALCASTGRPAPAASGAGAVAEP